MKLFFLRHRIHILAGCLLLLLFPAGCDNDDRNPASAPPPGQQQILRIGILPEQNIFVQKKRYASIARYLSRKSGIKVELKILRRYGNILKNFRAENLDGAFFGSFTGALAIEALDLQPIARPEYPNGISTYHGLIFVRKDSGIKSGADMQGKVFAFVDKATTAGWLLPLHYFRDQGIPDYATWFRETYFSGTHEDAIYDVLNGKADVGAAKNLIFDQFARTDSRILNELAILAVSPEVPSNTLILRRDLPEPLKKQIKELLLTMPENREGLEALRKFGAVRFLETEQQDFQPVFDFAGHIDLDLKFYYYLND
jgi:phosphonate transport system substrate-binding protein